MNKEKLIYSLLCVLLLIYIVLRSIHVPLVHDEVATYVHFILPGEFIPGESLADANNHHLNSFLSILCDRLFGTTPLALRLPNILFFLVMAIYTKRLADRFDDGLLRWALIFSLLGSHYLMEFHGLCRGYGMAMACFTACLYHIHLFTEKTGLWPYLGFIFFMALGLSASLTFLFPYLILFISSLYFLIRYQNSLWNYLLAVLGAGVIYVAIRVSVWLNESGALYYGAEGSFWEKTVGTLTTLVAGENILFPYLFTAMALFALIPLLRVLPKIMDTAILKSYLFHLAFFGSILGIILSHFIMGTHYPEDRVAVYLYPLLICVFLTSINMLRRVWPAIRWTAVVLFYLPLHFLLNINLNHVDFWFRERVPDSFYIEIAQFEEQYDRPPMVSGYHTTALTYFMNAGLRDYKVPSLVHHGFPNESADFIITRINEASLSFDGHEIFREDEVSGNRLWQKKKPSSWDLYQESKNTIPELPGEFFEFMRLKVPGKGRYVLDIELNYDDIDPVTKLHLVMNMKNSQGADHAYIPYEIHWRRSVQTPPLSTTLFADGSGDDENELLVYLWNIKKHRIRNLSYTMKLYQIRD